MISWNTFPFLRLILFLIAGIISGVYLNHPIPWLLFFSMLLAITLFIADRNLAPKLLFTGRKIFGIIILFLVYSVGYTLANIKDQRNAQSHYLKQGTVEWIQGVVTQIPVQKAKSIQINLSIEQVKKDNVWIASSGKMLCYFVQQSALDLMPGDKIVIRGSGIRDIDPPHNPGEFHYKSFLEKKNIFQQAMVADGDWQILQVRRSFHPYYSILELRKYLLHELEKNGLKGNELSVTSSLLLGYREKLDKELLASYAGAGAIHVLAVSGLHVGIIYLVVQWLFSFLKRSVIGRRFHLLIMLLTLWFYACITGLSPSVVRAATMFSAIAIGSSLKRPTNIYNSIALSAFLLLLYNPFYLFEVGFLLSYSAVIGIVFFQPRIYALLHFDFFLWNWIWKLTAVSIAAQITTLPLVMHFFHQFPTYFIFSNLVVIPAITLILYIGTVFFIFLPFPVIAERIAELIHYLVYGVNSFVGLIEELPLSVIKRLSLFVPEVIAVYLIVLFIMAWMSLRKVKYLILMLTSLFLVIAHRGMVNWQKLNQQQFYVLSIPNDLVLSFSENNFNTYLAKDTTEARRDYFLNSFWNEEQMALPHFINYTLPKDTLGFRFFDYGIMVYNGESYAIYGESTTLPARPLNIDYLLIDNNWRSLENVLGKYRPKVLIGHLPRWNKSAGEIIRSRKGMIFHNLADGAYERISNLN